MYIPRLFRVKKNIKDEIHKMSYSSHPSYHKTIATSRKQYFWPGMKRMLLSTLLDAWNVSKSRLSITSKRIIAAFATFEMEMGDSSNGFYYWTTKNSEAAQFHHDCG